MTVAEAEVYLRQMLSDAGFDFARPSPALAWALFKKFAVVPVDSANGRECEELWFEASDGGPEPDKIGYFGFVRQFLQDTEGGNEFHEQITAQFTCDASEQLGLGEGSVQAADLSDLPAFFHAVEGSDAFKAGRVFAGWSFEVRIDVC